MDENFRLRKCGLCRQPNEILNKVEVLSINTRFMLTKIYCNKCSNKPYYKDTVLGREEFHPFITQVDIYKKDSNLDEARKLMPEGLPGCFVGQKPILNSSVGRSNAKTF